MAACLVRWKFGANSLLNQKDEDTGWHQQIHPNKDEALSHYVQLLRSAHESPGLKMEVEIFKLVRLNPSN